MPKRKTKATSEGVAPTVIASESSVAQQSKPWQFKPGVSGNPAGRPKGSRNKLDEEFVSALLKSFSEGGQRAVDTVRDTDPAVFLNVIAKILPKQIEKKVDVNITDMSDHELLRIAAASSARASAQEEHSTRLN